MWINFWLLMLFVLYICCSVILDIFRLKNILDVVNCRFWEIIIVKSLIGCFWLSLNIIMYLYYIINDSY